MDMFADLAAASNDRRKESSPLAIGSKEPKRKSGNEDILFDESSTKKMKRGKDSWIFKGFFGEQKGERMEMQDVKVLMDEFELKNSISKNLSFYGMFDGHAGIRASRFAAEKVPEFLRLRLDSAGESFSFDESMKRLFQDVYKRTDEEFLQEASMQKPAWKDGTTALSILVVDSVMYIANLGDSKAVLCRWNEAKEEPMVLSLSSDHSPTNYEERKRIQKCGGTVVDGRLMGMLEVSRSIGDGPYKNHGLICTPDVKRCSLSRNDRFILLACDGLWKAFTSKSAVKFVLDSLAKRPNAYQKAAEELANEAVRRMSADNVTVIVVQIVQPETS